ncbi:MAG: MFS transporter [Gammaproteobacteria bacterium]|nr:MFS transporter [Gammaproteobacteria bacterium]
MLLATCQALMMSSNTLVVASSPLVGMTLAEDKSLASLPLSAQLFAGMLMSVPAAFFLEKVGRKRGFMLATLLGMIGGIVTATAIVQGSFWLFVAGVATLGLFNGFGNYYRFAAADVVDVEHKSRAISYVMIGGVVAAIVGPNLANWTRLVVESAPFSFSYATILILYITSFIVLSFTRIPKVKHDEGSELWRPPRAIGSIMIQPRFVVAILSAALGYAVMALVMTASPLAMQHHHHDFSDTSFVIQWHVLGMFAPSFFTGHLIRRFGLIKIIFVGTVLSVVSVAINLLGTSVSHFWWGLLFLGISWNFLFIGGTTMLTETYHQSERSKTQAINDVTVFSFAAAASLSAGVLQHHFGWEMVNLSALPMLAIILVALGWLVIKERSGVADKVLQ